MIPQAHLVFINHLPTSHSIYTAADRLSCWRGRSHCTPQGHSRGSHKICVHRPPAIAVRKGKTGICLCNQQNVINTTNISTDDKIFTIKGEWGPKQGSRFAHFPHTSLRLTLIGIAAVPEKSAHWHCLY